ncbi:MAG: 4Fe-4S dicluster domain-containing protein [Moorella sp. (in: Bacteria)]|nr:4Fe-4S dicluster domain-containing protein [Moorella sp. (in: firmicutes)]
MKLHLLEDIYPAGDEHLLVYNVSGKVIPPGGLPIHSGAVVLNVETLYNIARALNGQPVTHKFLTITGAVRQPVTVKVPLGVSAGDLLALAGGTTVEDYLLIQGGPCMGKPVTPGIPVTKTTKGIIVLPSEHPLASNYQRSLRQDLHRALAICSQCRQCSDFCPRNLLGHPLEPHRVMRAVTYGQADADALPQALLCSECGVCDLFACPFGLSPRQINRRLKAELAQKKYRPTWQAQDILPCPQGRQIPGSRLLWRLGLNQYDRMAPWVEANPQVREVRLPLQQHAGTAALPVVQPGQQVQEGELIARMAAGAVGANIHASIDGTVVAVNGEIIIRGGGA